MMVHQSAIQHVNCLKPFKGSLMSLGLPNVPGINVQSTCQLWLSSWLQVCWPWSPGWTQFFENFRPLHMLHTLHPCCTMATYLWQPWNVKEQLSWRPWGVVPRWDRYSPTSSCRPCPMKHATCGTCASIWPVLLPATGNLLGRAFSRQRNLWALALSKALRGLRGCLINIAVFVWCNRPMS